MASGRKKSFSSNRGVAVEILGVYDYYMSRAEVRAHEETWRNVGTSAASAGAGAGGVGVGGE